MMDDDKLLAEFGRNMTEFFTSTNLQREEIAACFRYMASHQISSDVLSKRAKKDKPTTIINLAAPLIRAVSGTECMADKALDMIALDPDFDKETDIMRDSAGYVRHASGADSERSRAKEDAATCGIGGTVMWLDMSQKDAIAGVPVCERIFPGFIAYDDSSRGSRINAKARWVGYAEAVNSRYLDDRIEEAIEDGAQTTGGGGTDYRGFLLSFSRQENLSEIDFVYHYFWHEHETIIDVMNPFVEGGDMSLIQAIMQDADAADLIGKTAEDLAIDWQAQYWSLDKESFKTLRNAIEVIGGITGIEAVKLNTSKRKGKCYYKAEIARGMVLSKSRSYTQGGHALNLVTGYYDETMGVYYGLMRSLSWVQDALNMTMSDFLGYASSASHGGNSYIKGGADAIERIKKEKSHEDAVTPIPKDAEIIPKGLPSTPQALVEFIRLMIELMPRVVGLGQEFLGVLTTGDMTDALYGKVMKQSYAVLANLANNAAESDRRQGEIEIDIVRLMAEANDGMVLPIMSPGKQKEQYIRLTRQNLARRYAVRVAEREMTVDERQNTFNQLSQLAPQYQQAGINIMPILAKYARLDSDDRDELIKLATPQPAQPDPVNQAMLEGQTRLINAQAAKLEQEATGTTPKTESDIEKNLAMAAKYRADAGQTAVDAVMPRINQPSSNV